MRNLMILSLGMMAATLLAIGVWTQGSDPPDSGAEQAASSRPEDLGYVPPRHYICYRARGPIAIDGRLDKEVWRETPWTEDFVDIEGPDKPKPRFRTRARMLWDDQYFYVGAELAEPHVWATLTKHDSVIFRDNDFEVFIDPNGDNHEYYEFEINALNTSWDLFLPRPYRDMGKALDTWEIPGLKTSVHIEGTLNNPGDTDIGWTVEIAFPWKALVEMQSPQARPRDGDQWRVNFSRVEWRHRVVKGKYEKVPRTKEDNWVWSPQGKVNMHMPEKWGYVQFSTATEPGTATFRPDPAGPARHLLHKIYYAQREYHKKHGRYARTLPALGLARLGHESLTGPPRMEVTASGFEATVEIKLPGGKRQFWHIRQDSWIWPDL
jgi:hypothetical protein